MIRKSLFLILTLALLFVPVLSMAHAFTHFAQTDVLNAIDSEGDAGVDLDEICLDCLALTVLSIIYIASGLSLSDLETRGRFPAAAMEHHSDNKPLFYHSRAPPLFPLIH
jgi:hypothetical protein